jgi:hypothetical protein
MSAEIGQIFMYRRLGLHDAISEIDSAQLHMCRAKHSLFTCPRHKLGTQRMAAESDTIMSRLTVQGLQASVSRQANGPSRYLKVAAGPSHTDCS